jgi:hypothetical protein
MKKSRLRSVNNRPVLEGLEPRLLFSADALGGMGPVSTPDYEADLDTGFYLGAFAP